MEPTEKVKKLFLSRRFRGDHVPPGRAEELIRSLIYSPKLRVWILPQEELGMAVKVDAVGRMELLSSKDAQVVIEEAKNKDVEG